jgi:ssRNA-specific RNase YbeY (16S rRNA maturation enzyme)
MDHEEDTEAALMEALEQQLLAAHHREPGARP